MKSIYTALAIATLLSITSTSCVSYSRFQSAKTLKPGKMSLGTDISFGVNANRNDFIPVFFNVGANARMGLTDNLDIGLSIGGISAATDVKIMFLGDHNSKFAMATGVGLQASLIGPGLEYNMQFPLYASYHPNENTSLFLSPKYSLLSSPAESNVGLYKHFAGASVGFLAGKNLKVGAELTYLYHTKRVSRDSPIVGANMGFIYVFDWKKNDRKKNKAID